MYPLQEGRFANAQESRLQGAKIWNMKSAVQQWVWFADAQESCFHGTKRWNMGSSVHQWRRFADAQDSHIQGANRSKTGSAVPTVFDLLMLTNRLFSLQKLSNVWLLPWKTSICWYSGIMFWGLETFTYRLYSPAICSICFFSEFAFSAFEKFKYG